MLDLPENIAQTIWDAVHGAPVVDIRCFVQPPEAGSGHASGLDALLSSGPILEEFFLRRSFAEPVAKNHPHGEENLSALSHGEIADLVWRRLFLDQSPLSEATRVVLTSLGLFGMPVDKRDLNLFREQFAAIPPAERLARTFAIANIEAVLYPVDCLAVDSAAVKAAQNPRFRPVLSLDPMFADWKESARRMRGLGFGVKGKIDDFAPLELRRFLTEQVNNLNPAAISYDWASEDKPASGKGVARLIREAVLPLAAERGLPLLLTGGGRAGPHGENANEPPDVREFASLWNDRQDARFLFFPTDASQLPAARLEAGRSGNLLLCGPDGPLSNPATLAEFTLERLESCGSAFHACHSGATVLEELTGRWAHLRWTMGKTLQRRYAELWRTGWRFAGEEVAADVKALFGGNAKRFLKL